MRCPIGNIWCHDTEARQSFKNLEDLSKLHRVHCSLEKYNKDQQFRDHGAGGAHALVKIAKS